MTRIQANLFLLMTGAIWGAGFVAQSTAMESMGPLWFIAIRFGIATLVALPLALFEARRATTIIQLKDYRNFILIGLALFMGSVTQQIGLLTTTVTNSGFLTGLYVVFVPVLTVVLLRRKPHWIIWPAACLSALGIFLLSGGQVSTLVVGDALTIVCAVFWALQVMMVGLFVGDTGRPMMLSTVQFAVCSLAGFLVALFYEPISWQAISETLPELLYAGVFSSGVAFICQVVGQRYTTAPQAAIFLSSEALFAALFGIILLGETISPIGYLGCAILFAAMLLVELGPELLRGKGRTALE